MKLIFAVLALAFAGVVGAQVNLITLDVRQLMSKPWITVGSSGTKIYSYQISHAIHYAPEPNPENKNYDVVLRVGTKGPYGTVTHTRLTFFSIICNADSTMADQIFLGGTHEYASDASSLPNAPADETFNIEVPRISANVEEGSPSAIIGKRLCSKHR